MFVIVNRFLLDLRRTLKQINVFIATTYAYKHCLHRNSFIVFIATDKIMIITPPKALNIYSEIIITGGHKIKKKSISPRYGSLLYYTSLFHMHMTHVFPSEENQSTNTWNVLMKALIS